MKHITEKNGDFYLVTESEKMKIEDAEVKAALTEYDSLPDIDEQIVTVSCFNPECSNQINLTIRQKRDQLISFPKKYGKMVFICCCETCQQRLLELFNGDTTQTGDGPIQIETKVNRDKKQ